MTKKGTGFSAPAIGTMVPKGATFKKGANGRLVMVLPKTASKNTSTKKGKKK